MTLNTMQIMQKWNPVVSKCLEIPDSKKTLFAVSLEIAYNSGKFSKREMTNVVIPRLREKFGKEKPLPPLRIPISCDRGGFFIYE